VNLKRILLVEDSPEDVELTLAALSEHNFPYEVVVVRDGEEALDYLYGRGRYAARPVGNPAVVLLDLTLPTVDGFEVLEVVKQDPKLRSMPIVMLTSSREERDVVSRYELGADAYVVKPVELESFVQALRGLGLF
jgi:CheY-like chemotaxis protein